MKILMDDGMQIQLGTGIGKYSKYLYDAMSRNGCDISLVKEAKRTGNRMKDRFAYIKYINSKQFQRDVEGYDVVLFTNYTMPIRKDKRTKYITAVPDMVAFLYPETLPPFYRYYNQIMIRNTVKRADLVFTISKSVEKEIVQKFPDCKERIRTTWLGLYDGICPLDYYEPYGNEKLVGIDDTPFFLFVSTVEKRKNVGLVIDAFLKLKQESPEADDYKLVIAGRPGYGYDEFVEMVERSDYSQDVVFTGYITDSDCNRLYNHATAFVFPTVYEGFGFAQIECMRCHLPIILSDIPTNREISRDYGEFFQLKHPETLMQKMQLFVNDEYDYETKNKLADQYIGSFDWNKIAEQYMVYINEIIERDDYE